MQSYFSSLPLDHLSSGFLKWFSKIFPIEADVKMFYTIVVPHNPRDHELNKTDFALYQETLM
jgi:hypothetical protein